MILIADDNEDDAIAVVQTLKAAGVKKRLTLVEDGKDVIAYLRGDKTYADRAKYPVPTVLLLDLKMPRLGGFEVLEWFRHAMPTRDILIVILSGNQNPEILNRGYALGARSFVRKPCRTVDIQNLVRAYSSYWQPTPRPI